MNLKDFSMNIRVTNENLHKAAEVTGFNNRLVSGKASKETYAEFIFNYIPVYRAIETALNSLKNSDKIKPFVTPELYRSELLEKDVKFILGDKFDSMELLSSTKAYVARIEEISKSNPILVIAHAYTRFLADLFGGRTIYQIVKENYSVEEGGLNYFQFPNIPNIMEYVLGYRDNLTKMNLTDDQQTLFLNEVSNSYIYNIGISTELEAKLYTEKSQGHSGGHPHGKMPAGHPPINGHNQMPVGHPPVGHGHHSHNK